MTEKDFSFESSYEDMYSQIRHALQAKVRSDPEYQRALCVELWQQTSPSEREELNAAYTRRHPGASVADKGFFIRRQLLRRHLAQQTILAMQLEELFSARPADEVVYPPSDPSDT